MNKDWQQIPVFVVSNTGGSKRQHYLHLGAVEYYVKSENRLEKIVEDICIKIKGGDEDEK